MTLTQTLTWQSFDCDGVTRDFAFGFPFFAAEDLRVALRDGTSGDLIPLAADADFTVIGALEGAAAIRTAIAHPAGRSLVVSRATSLTQPLQYAENDPFPARSHERALDRAAARDQELASGLEGAVRRAPSDGGDMRLPPVAQRAGRLLVFDADGDENFVRF